MSDWIKPLKILFGWWNWISRRIFSSHRNDVLDYSAHAAANCTAHASFFCLWPYGRVKTYFSFISWQSQHFFVWKNDLFGRMADFSFTCLQMQMWLFFQIPSDANVPGSWRLLAFNFMVNNSCVPLGSALLTWRLWTVDVLLCKCVKVVYGHDIYIYFWVIFVMGINSAKIFLTWKCLRDMWSKIIAGKFKHGLESVQLNISSSSSHVSITLTLNLDIKASVFFKRPETLKNIFVVIQLRDKSR